MKRQAVVRPVRTASVQTILATRLAKKKSDGTADSRSAGPYLGQRIAVDHGLGHLLLGIGPSSSASASALHLCDAFRFTNHLYTTRSEQVDTGILAVVLSRAPDMGVHSSNFFIADQHCAFR